MGNVTAIVAPFVAAAAAAGVKPPVRVIGLDERCWTLVRRRGDTLAVDAFGDLWWVRCPRRGDARVIRDCWPEEASALCSSIAEALAGHALDPR